MNAVLGSTILLLLALVLPASADSLITGGPYTVGDEIIISGDTNYNTDNQILVEVYPASFGPTKKYEPSMTGGNSTIVPVVKGESGLYSWSANMSSAGWTPDQYMVRTEVIGKNFIETSVITLSEKGTLPEKEGNQTGSNISSTPAHQTPVNESTETISPEASATSS